MDRKRGREDDEGAGGQDNNEISLSIEETNKLRISLGLKPLVMGAPKADDEARKRGQEQRQKQEQQVRAQQFLAKQAVKKTQAEQDSFLAVRGLGEDDSVDDTQAWAERQEVEAAARRAEAAYAARAKAAEEAAKRARAEARDEDDEGGPGYSTAELAGMKVRHNVDELGEGETVVLTLAEAPLIVRKGHEYEEAPDDDMLENVLKAEDRKRSKARDAAAPKAKPLWEEDGKKRGLLEKYNEEEADIVIQLGANGAVDTERLKAQEEVKRKLAEAGRKLDSAAVGVLAPPGSASHAGPSIGAGSASDYQSTAEAAAAGAGKMKRRKGDKKERKMRAKSPELEADGDGSTAALIEALEAEAETAAASGRAPVAGSELGSRTAREGQRALAEAAQRQAVLDKRARFEAAVAKGNWASQALKAQPAITVGDEDEEADRELRESLARARRLAAAQSAQATHVGAGPAQDQPQGPDAMETEAKPAHPTSTLEAIAAAAAKKREEDEARVKQELAAKALGGAAAAAAPVPAAAVAVKKEQLLVDDMSEFVRNIQAKDAPQHPHAPGIASVAAGVASSRLPPPPPPPGAAAKAKAEQDDGYMGLGAAEEPAPKPAQPKAPKGWVAASLDDEAASAPNPDDAAMEVEEAAGPSGVHAAGEAGAGVAGGKRVRHGRKKAAQDGEAASGQESGEEGEEDGEEAESSDDELSRKAAHERRLGSGMAAALALLKDKGDLNASKHIVWAGRTNDRSKNALLGVVGDVYTGGSHEDRLARSIEAALTTKDEFGRVMTPKERFRRLNYDFHGKKPSLNKEANRLKKAAEEIARRKNATSEVADMGEVAGLIKVTEKVKQPYVVLQGKGAMETLKSAGLHVTAGNAAKPHTHTMGGKAGNHAGGKKGGSGKPPKPPS